MQMSKQEIEDALLGFFEEECNLPPDEVRAETKLFSVRKLDSLDFLDLTAFLEEHFGIDLDTRAMALDAFDTLESIVALVTKELESKSSSQ